MAGDLNGDGRTDIVGYSAYDSISVALAGPGGVFGPPVAHSLEAFGSSGTSGDRRSHRRRAFRRGDLDP